jgi:hypothetical protein
MEKGEMIPGRMNHMRRDKMSEGTGKGWQILFGRNIGRNLAQEKQKLGEVYTDDLLMFVTYFPDRMHRQ